VENCENLQSRTANWQPEVGVEELSDAGLPTAAARVLAQVKSCGIYG
jgi:hypothetical protein